MQSAVGYPPCGPIYPTPQAGNYQAVQLGDNSFAQQPQYLPGMYFNPMSIPNVPGLEAFNELMKLQNMKGFQRLEEAKGVFIKQQFIFTDALGSGCTCESPNVYKVFQADSNGKQTGSTPILQCKDKSDCCARCWCGPDCLPLNMKVSKEDRPCQCACLCVNRPVMSVVLSEDNQNKVIGKVKSPCYGCSIGVQIEDAAGNLKYTIEGSQCQMGYICMPCCCEPCLKFNLEVKDASGQIITHAVKQTPGFYKSNEATNFALGFPENATPEDKAILVAGILMIDFMHFENKRKTQRRRRGF